MKNMIKKGVSLIVLVVTIIVMIILSGVTIVSLGNDNSIDKSKLAVLKTNVSQIIEETNQYALENYDRENRIYNYPTERNLTKEEIDGLPEILKESFAKNQQKINPDGSLNIEGIDPTKVFYLDKSKVPSAKSIKSKIILCVLTDRSLELYFEEPKTINKTDYYKLTEVLDKDALK